LIPKSAQQPAVDADADEALPSFSEQLAQQLGGVRGLIESGVPVLVFVIFNAAFTRWPVHGVSALRLAVGAAVASAVALATYRLARKESIRTAVNGLFGVFVGAALALRSGQARDFFLLGIVLSLAYAIAMLVSVAIRRPLVGWVYSIVAGGGTSSWRDKPYLLRTFSWLTVMWAGIYLAKVAVQAPLYYANQVDALGVARLALGYPPYLMLIAFTVWAVRRSTHRAGETEPTA
jgi:hypothetical protein